MAENDEMIIATSDIAFAVKKDGSTIIDKNLEPSILVKVYKALTEYSLNCEESDLMLFAFVELLCSGTLHSVIERRVMSLKRDKE